MFTIWMDVTRCLTEGKHTGVPKTIYNLALNLIKESNENFNVMLVKIEDGHLRICKTLAESLSEENCQDEIVSAFKRGDVFLLGDAIYDLGENTPLFSLIEDELCVIPFLHDIIPVTHAKYAGDVKSKFYSWIVNVTNFKTGIIANSLSTANSFLQRFHYHYPIGYIHLGCDKDNLSIEELSLPKGKNVLMVSTIEPRKMYSKTLEQFERIWEKRDDINLIIVGKKGWMVDELMEKIETHVRKDKNLYHYQGLTEGQLAYLYKNCDVFLFSSEVEGFGLGVIEAGRFGTPLLLRDIPVFREIAGDFATYFNNFEELPELIEKWDFKRSNGMKINSWEETTKGCLKIIDGIRNQFLSSKFKLKNI